MKPCLLFLKISLNIIFLVNFISYFRCNRQLIVTSNLSLTFTAQNKWLHNIKMRTLNASEKHLELNFNVLSKFVCYHSLKEKFSHWFIESFKWLYNYAFQTARSKWKEGYMCFRMGNPSLSIFVKNWNTFDFRTKGS